MMSTRNLMSDTVDKYHGKTPEVSYITQLQTEVHRGNGKELF